MTTLQVQIPVTRFSVPFELGASRPYSAFEQLLLRAINAGVTDLSTLSDTFAVPSRLVIEGVVTLIQAGWVGLGSDDNALLTTPAGIAAVESRQRPTTLTTTRPNPIRIVMERVNGTYCRNSDLTLFREQDLDRADNRRIIRLPAQVHDNHLDTGDVRPLLRVDPGQWIRWISSEAQLVSKGALWAVGNFDSATGRLSHLPDSFRSSLEPLLVARHDGPRECYVPEERLPTDIRRCRLTIDDDDLIVNASAHQSLLQRALEEAATHVVICSAFLTETVLKAVAPAIGSALRRGTNVDLLWGYAGSGPRVSEPLELVRKLQWDHREAAGALSFNDHPSGSHAKLLIWDDTAGSCVNACIGSYNWLSGGSTAMGELSVRIRQPALVADLARFVADRWGEIPGARLDVAQRRWHQLAARWERASTETEDVEHGVTASLVFGRAHEAALRRALVDTSPGVLVITSHRVAAVGLRRLDDGKQTERADFTGALVAGELLEDVTAEEIKAAAASLGVRHLIRPIHAKLLIHGDTVLIGSYNYLSADPPSRGGRARELSLRLDGVSSRQLVQARLRDLFRPTERQHQASD